MLQIDGGMGQAVVVIPLHSLWSSAVESFGGATSAELLTAAAIATVTCVVVAEITILSLRDAAPGSQWTTAAAMGVGSLVSGSLLTGAYLATFEFWASFAPDQLRDLWDSHRVSALIAGFVVYDAVGHLHHLVGHKTAIGWAAHSPHHSGDRFDMSLALRQSWFPIHGVLVLPLVAVGGFRLTDIAVCAALSNVIQGLQHCAIAPTAPAWFRAVVVTPTHHRLHHLEVAGATAVNFGPVFTIWDRIGGSYVTDQDAVALHSPRLGNPVQLQLAGWRELVAQFRTGSGQRRNDVVDALGEQPHVARLDSWEASDA